MSTHKCIIKSCMKAYTLSHALLICQLAGWVGACVRNHQLGAGLRTHPGTNCLLLTSCVESSK